ncbi:MAG TPA: hypothetical protein ENK17_05780 [Anaerolineae bacterium]|nr:hypothetical protein [Anaerolineae bacterium]
MLEQLLELLRAGGTHRVQDLARALDTTPEMVTAMLEGLGRMGYLKPVSASCDGECRRCPLAGMCAAGVPGSAGQGSVWSLVDADS